MGFSRFLNKWPWSPEHVAQTWLQRFRQRMVPTVQAEHQRLKAERPKSVGRPKTTVVTGYLIYDDLVHMKLKGCKMGGIGRHYSSTERRVVPGHCLFTGLYRLLGHCCPLVPEMYRQKAVCEREEVAFRSKIAMTVESIGRFEPVPETKTHVLLDSWFHCKRVRRAAQARGWDFSGGLKSNRIMRMIAPDGSREWLPLLVYAARLSEEDWVEVIWPSEQGGQVMCAHVVQTWIRKLGPTLLLITRHSLDDPLAQARY